MAEFDSSAFSAVDKFFGHDDKTGGEKRIQGTTGEAAVSSSSFLAAKGKARRGVGNTVLVHSKASSLLTQRFLKLGKNRSRDHHDDDDDASNVAEKDNEDDDDDEFDIGRTAIAESRKKQVNKDSNPKQQHQQDTEATKKMKRKLGKRERQSQASKTTHSDEKAPSEPTHNQSLAAGGGDATDSCPVEPTDVDATTSKKSSQPRKRRKVRSRQKNIRKDNRAVNEKPAYLIPGTPNYQGRPLTQATREKLSLPPPVGKRGFVVGKKPVALATQDGLKISGTSVSVATTTVNDEDASSHPLFVIDRGESTAALSNDGGADYNDTDNDVGAKLAIDDFQLEGAGDNEAADGDAEENPSKKISKRKKKKKSM
eukprot:CAMPEP_0178751524 /NCGR_PEP_ID=MMETSP0744-20121128/10572_1 /TAXON_ID=913974 /ORGANISM="Nitzschia punctata, Strain CCMP561" /LENGTH=368 /DNA_ID=CAMNT_0020405175 /DNA_START=201 /DNA_END=1308 /DNA_ORIENTATION=-